MGRAINKLNLKEKPSPAVEIDDDGFNRVVNRKSKGSGPTSQKQNFVGVRIHNPKTNLIYQSVKTTTKDPKPGATKTTNEEQDNGIKLKNLFEKLNEITIPVTGEASGGNDMEDILGGTTKDNHDDILDALNDDDEEVDEVYIEKMCSKVFKQWQWTSNGLMCYKGSRIILGQNSDIVNVVVISFNAQVMHACVYFKADKNELFCSFVYAHNRYIQRRDLWTNLVTHKNYIQNRPWCILGDFNVSLNADENSTGLSYIDTGMRDFQECVEAIEVSDVNSTGLRFTWNQKTKGNNGILKKIDRIMAN
ncbi:RNA-directed DNA polymerase, eukaryota, reverse transcriptase zinc-binding domain protein [Tanacetum coccineum]